MKKTLLAFILVLLASMMARFQTLDVANANFIPAPATLIYSPAPIIYTNTSIPLRVSVNILEYSPRIVRVLYSIDENSNVTLTNLTSTDNVWFEPYKKGTEFNAISNLDNLTEGNHTLKVYSQDAEGEEMFSSVEFTIDTQYKYAEVLILSPQNKTYTTTEVPLTWTCDEQITSHAEYFLDYPLYGSTTLPGNTTLTGLSNGTHTITVFAFTKRGQANSQAVHFTVSPETQSQTESFPTTLVIAVVVAVAVIGVGLFVYFKKLRIDKTYLNFGASMKLC